MDRICARPVTGPKLADEFYCNELKEASDFHNAGHKQCKECKSKWNKHQRKIRDVESRGRMDEIPEGMKHCWTTRQKRALPIRPCSEEYYN